MTSSQLVSQSSLLGLILAMCVYTKLSTLIVFMFVVIVTVPALRAKLFATQQFLQFGCVSCGLGLVLASPWLIRNTMLYGDPAGQHLFKQVFVQTTMTASRMTEMQHGLLGYWRYFWLDFLAWQRSKLSSFLQISRFYLLDSPDWLFWHFCNSFISIWHFSKLRGGISIWR